MNNLYLGGAGVIGALIFALYRWGLGKAVEATIQHTRDADKSLQQKQTENEAKLAQVNKDLDALYKERNAHLDQQKTDEERADHWNTPPDSH